MLEPERIAPKEAYRKSNDGTALLVCAYDDEDKFRSIDLERAISFKEFKSKVPNPTTSFTVHCRLPAWPSFDVTGRTDGFGSVSRLSVGSAFLRYAFSSAK